MRSSLVLTLLRSSRIAAVALLLLVPTLLSAASLDLTPPSEQAVAQLEQRAQLARPREQCFLYTELVHMLTEMAGQDMRNGEFDHASLMLKRVEHYAQLIHLGLADDTKRLKNAEQLMQHTTFRLNGLLRAASVEDRETLKSTLKQLDQVQDELMAQVFKH